MPNTFRAALPIIILSLTTTAFAQSHSLVSTPMRASAAEEESLRTLTAQYGRTLVAGDLDALRKFWNPQSPNLAAQLRSYKNVFAQARLEFTSSDVTRLEPDIANKSVKGTVLIRFLIKSNNLTHVEFDCGDLTIDKVRLRGTTLQFAVNNRRLKSLCLTDYERTSLTRSRLITTAHRDVEFASFPIENRSTPFSPPAIGWSA
jgi:hypothetical protein